MAIGINVLDLKKIKVGNMLPAVIIPILYFIGRKLIGLI